jgi:hypothetical protein
MQYDYFKNTGIFTTVSRRELETFPVNAGTGCFCVSLAQTWRGKCGTTY